MARGPFKFTQHDVTRAVKGATQAGVDVLRVVIETTGNIVIVAGKPDDKRPDEGGNEWDRIS
jgi:hypothetical protein